ncbi:MAG: MBL fold metallo-hydrolase [Armatimonadota bacterium]
MSKKLRITVLKENSAARPGVLPGHGLSLLVESAKTRVLLDTGPDATLLDNAAALGISLAPLDAVVLSHGHYDHTGGLAAVLEELGPTRVIAHPGIFDDTYSRGSDGAMRQIGIPEDHDHCCELGARFEFSDLPVRLDEGIMSTGHIAPVRPTHAPGSSLMRRGQSGLVRDDFRDDVSLVVQLADCSAVITGCAHAGLLNILYKAQTIVPGRPPRVVLGGLHMGLMNDEEIAEIAAEAYSLGVRVLLPCHCTGDRAVAVLREKFRGTVIPVGTGAVITIDPHGGVRADTKADLKGRHK